MTPVTSKISSKLERIQELSAMEDEIAPPSPTADGMSFVLEEPTLESIFTDSSMAIDGGINKVGIIPMPPGHSNPLDSLAKPKPGSTDEQNYMNTLAISAQHNNNLIRLLQEKVVSSAQLF